MMRSKSELGALAGDWDRRADELHERHKGTDLFLPLSRDMCVLRRCAEELRAHLESALPERESESLPAVSSGEWLERLTYAMKQAEQDECSSLGIGWSNKPRSVYGAMVRAALRELGGMPL